MTIKASMNSLLADGWAECRKRLVPAMYYPAGGRIVIERGDDVLVHVYAMGVDSSDWYGNDFPVEWKRAKLVPVALFEVKLLDEPA